MSHHNLQESYDHVIVGGGVAADKAARAITERTPDASILIITRDAEGPVFRPDLTKGLWLDDSTTVEDISLGTSGDTGAQVATGTSVTSIDPSAHTVTIDTGDTSDTVTYGTLLLATGASPKTLDGVDSAADDRVAYIRSVSDYRSLRDKVTAGTRVAVVGGGYIGSEAAVALNAVGATVDLYTPDDRVLGHMFPASITDHLEEVYAAKGVTVHHGFLLDRVDTNGDELSLDPSEGDAVTADVAVIGFGSVLETGLAQDAGLALEGGGVAVDVSLSTSADDVYAAGDIAVFTDPLLGRRHVEHVDNAEQSGTVAGTNMAGGAESYEYTPLFFSDIFDDGYEAVGTLSTEMDVVEDWNDDRTAAVVYYLDDGVVQGVLLWNTWDSVPAARKILSASKDGALSVDDLPGSIPVGDGE
ncbi:MAG TPA: NAD(P)/FAD-dependent oxidoreductase [Candidatus Corynebacterium avicola]|uniref:NAD(P)/FAD-dependent oxidoreductase n=1 Tax=Candidatus Corynebacterium avicola TaxID=2838527 RepID=A0A9D1RSP6_9CORY|nr:NAD(P)/FAD-dependent oxidoreductase [Candidatus Corynebacterium avicola]